MQNIDYSLNVKSPFESYAQGLQFGASLKEMQQKQLMEQQEGQRQALLQESVGALFDNNNPTAQDFARVASFLPPKEADSLRESWGLLDKERQDNDLRFGAQVMSAFGSDRPDIGVDMLRKRAEAEKNAGREEEANLYETYAQIAEVNPSIAQKNIGIMIAALPGGDKVIDSAFKAMKGPSEVQISELEAENLPNKLSLENLEKSTQIKNINDQISKRADQLNLDRDKFQSDIEARLYEMKNKQTELPQDARKLVNDAVVSSVAAEQSSGKTLELANRLENLGGGYGAFSSASEFLKRSTGNQDAWTQARQEYVRLRNSQAIKSLPPGPATDRDIELALRGFPGESSDSKVLASFLRGMAKMQQYEAASESAKSEWINAVGSLAKPKQDIEINGEIIPSGTSYTDFIRKSLEGITQKTQNKNNQNVLQGRSYMRWAQEQ